MPILTTDPFEDERRVERVAQRTIEEPDQIGFLELAAMLPTDTFLGMPPFARLGDQPTRRRKQRIIRLVLR